MKLAQGDIISVDFPFSDGSEIKRRPALVLSGEAIHHTGDVLLMQITSKARKDGMNLLLENQHLTTPLPLKSFVRLHKIFTLDKRLIVSKLSHLQKSKWDEVIDTFFELIKKA